MLLIEKPRAKELMNPEAWHLRDFQKAAACPDVLDAQQLRKQLAELHDLLVYLVYRELLAACFTYFKTRSGPSGCH
jgi:hypothetical protein